MRQFSDGFKAHIASGATTLCWCWKLQRGDGVVTGYTDHDRALTFGGVTFEASAGFSAGDVSESIGLSVDNVEVTGALSSVSLSEDDLASGRYDDARIEIYRVNWANVAERALIRVGSLGEVKRAGGGFAAEVRGLAHYLQQPKGRLFQLACDADLGDARCRVALSSPAFVGAGVIGAVLGDRRFQVTGLDSYAADFFSRGLVTFSSGAASGLKIEVKAHQKTAAGVTIELWTPAAHAAAVGDGFSVSAGCDKRVETCRAKFANVENFRGFPSMPGNAYLMRIARRGAT